MSDHVVPYNAGGWIDLPPEGKFPALYPDECVIAWRRGVMRCVRDHVCTTAGQWCPSQRTIDTVPWNGLTYDQQRAVLGLPSVHSFRVHEALNLLRQQVRPEELAANWPVPVAPPTEGIAASE